MIAIYPQAVYIVLIILIAILLAFVLSINYYQRKAKNKLFANKSAPEFEKEIPEISQMHPPRHHAMFVDLSSRSVDMVELAVEIWRISNRITSASNGLTDIQKRGLESSVQKLMKFLDHNEIKIIDHTGEKYNEGMNVDVLSFEKDQNSKTPTIKETIEPSIICKGHVIKKGKIIVINN